MATIEEIELEMKEMRELFDVYARKLDDTLVEVRALGVAVEKLKANIKYMQDEVI